MLLREAVIIGTGNVAWKLGEALQKSGFSILGVAGRSGEKVQELATFLNSTPFSDWSEIPPETELCFFCVSDDALPELAKKIRLKNGFAVHTSGMAPNNVLNSVSEKFGVLWPLQTLSKNVKIDFKEIPLLIDAGDSFSKNLLADFAKKLSNRVHLVNEEERKKLHLAAVIVNNFTNHLFHLSESFLSESGLDFNLLRPLILETALKVQSQLPEAVQTGPAKRDDRSTIEAHMELLKQNPELLAIYRLLTQNIQKSR